MPASRNVQDFLQELKVCYHCYDGFCTEDIFVDVMWEHDQFSQGHALWDMNTRQKGVDIMKDYCLGQRLWYIVIYSLGRALIKWKEV